MLPTLLAGFGLGLSLIVAIGAQNLFVLRQGIRREHVVAVATVVFLIVGAIAATGVDVISVGALTHSARALDLGLDIAVSA